MAGENSVEDVPKWKIALAVGLPIGLGVAALWYYKNKGPGSVDSSDDHSKMVDPDRTDVDSVLSETSVLTEFVRVSEQPLLTMRLGLSSISIQVVFRPSATKSGRPYGVMYVSSWRNPPPPRHP